MILGGEPYVLYQTNNTLDLDEYEFYMKETFPEIKLLRQVNSLGRIVIVGDGQVQSCKDLRLKNPMANLTFNTSAEHQFHIPGASMLWDTYQGF